jgi:retron-type reverse transcriptase
MCHEWFENMDNEKINGVVLLDIKKAFDSINHRVLLNKMNEQFGIFGSEH